MDPTDPRFQNLFALYALLDIHPVYWEIWGSVPMMAGRNPQNKFMEEKAFYHILEFRDRDKNYYVVDTDLKTIYPELPIKMVYRGPGSYHIEI